MFRFLLLSFLTLSLHAETWKHYYKIEGIPYPPGRDFQVGGVAALPDGRVAFAFHRGEILIFNPADQSWSEFATGLHEPLGLVYEGPGSFAVMQRAELTRVTDTDQDGTADFFETLSDDFGMTGNYHEFSFGPAKDKEGNYYVALNVASNGAGIRPEIRGEWSDIGISRERMGNLANWAEEKKDAGRMYSRVPYRGWVLKITPEGKTVPFASGFRSPNGLGFDSKGRLYVPDNQGDWIGTSPLYHVEEGKHYGHPASLVWRENWDGRNPLNMSNEQLNALRTLPAARFPQGELANSPTQPIPTISPDKFGLPEDQMIIGDMNQFNLIRFIPDEVNGVTQGTLVPFIEGKEEDIANGNNRMDFDPSGNLWLGKTHLNWAGWNGAKVVKWKGVKPLLAEQVKLTPTGFKIQLSAEPGNPGAVNASVKRHTYNYNRDYGSKKIDLADESVSVSLEGKTITISGIEPMRDYLYTIWLSEFSDKDGNPILGRCLRYNVSEVPSAASE